MEEAKVNVKVETDIAKEKFLEETKKMKAKKNVVKKMCNELIELNEKLENMHRFLAKEIDNIDNDERYAILEQRKAMCDYAKILSKRINIETELFVKEV